MENTPIQRLTTECRDFLSSQGHVTEKFIRDMELAGEETVAKTYDNYVRQHLIREIGGEIKESLLNQISTAHLTIERNGVLLRRKLCDKLECKPTSQLMPMIAVGEQRWMLNEQQIRSTYTPPLINPPLKFVTCDKFLRGHKPVYPGELAVFVEDAVGKDVTEVRSRYEQRVREACIQDMGNQEIFSALTVKECLDTRESMALFKACRKVSVNLSLDVREKYQLNKDPVREDMTPNLVEVFGSFGVPKEMVLIMLEANKPKLTPIPAWQVQYVWVEVPIVKQENELDKLIQRLQTDRERFDKALSEGYRFPTTITMYRVDNSLSVTLKEI